MSGKGSAGGFDFQARAIAFVYVQVLAERALRWTPLPTSDVPTAVHGEGGGTGDDIRVELRDTDVVYECQAKRGLSADDRLDDAADLFAKGLPTRPHERGILVVDPTSARTIRHELKEGLEGRRLAAQTSESNALKRFLGRLRGNSAEAVAERIWVREMNVEDVSSPLELLAIDQLERLLDDDSQAPAAWGALVSHGLAMCRQGGRQTRADLVAFLGQSNIRLIAPDGGGGARGQLAALQSQMSQMMAMFASGSGAGAGIVTPAAVGASDVDQFTPRLDAARQVLLGGSPEAALSLLRELEPQMAGAGPAPRARLHNLIASALFHLERLDEARARLQTVLAIDPQNEIALGNLAQTELRREDLGAAIETAERLLELNPTAPLAWSALVQARPGTTVPPELENDPAVLGGRAAIKIREQAWGEAVELLRRAGAGGAEDPVPTLMLAQAIYNDVLAADGPADLGRLDEVNTLLTRAIGKERARGMSARLGLAYLIQGQIERLRGHDAAAITSFGIAAQVPAVAADAAYQLALAHLVADAPARALEAVDAIRDEHRSAALIAMRSRVLHALQREESAREELGRAAERNVGADHKADVAFLIAEIALDAGWADDAERYLSGAGDAEPWLTHLFRARIAARRDDHETAATEFAAAVAGSAGSARRKVLTEFAQHLRGVGDLERAIELLEAAGAPGYAVVRHLYARVLYEAKAITKIAALVEEVRSEVDDDVSRLPAWALNLGAYLSTVLNDVPKAVEYLTALATEDPLDFEAQFRLAQAYVRLRRPDEARRVLDVLAAREDLASRQLLHLAEMYMRAGAPTRALPLAYRAYRAEPGAADVQLGFVNVFLQRQGDVDPLPTDAVRVGTHVTLRTPDAATLGYLIVRDGPADPRLNELAADDPLAAQLLGKQVGDAVVLREGSLTELRTEIVEIKSDVVHAFQDITSKFNERHPTNPSLQAFKVSAEPTIDDFAPIFADGKARAARAEELLDLYSQHEGLPLGSLSRGLGAGIGDVYARLAADPKRSLYVEFADGHAAAEAAAGSDLAAVVTHSALTTIAWLDLFEVVRRTHPKLLAPRSLVDELLEERHRLEQHVEDGHAVVAHTAEGLRAVEEPATSVRGRLARLDRALEWVTTACEVRGRPVASLIEADADKVQLALGASSYDAMWLAEAEGGHLYADDLGLRRLALGRTGKIGFSTYALVRAAQSAGHLEPEAAHRMVASLLAWSHEFLPMTPAVLRAALQANGYHIVPEVANLINRLGTAQASAPQLALFCAESLREAALAGAGPGALGTVAMALTEALVKRFGGRHAQALLERALEVYLALLPEAHDACRDAVMRYVSLVASGRPLVSGTDDPEDDAPPAPPGAAGPVS